MPKNSIGVRSVGLIVNNIIRMYCQVLLVAKGVYALGLKQKSVRKERKCFFFQHARFRLSAVKWLLGQYKGLHRGRGEGKGGYPLSLFLPPPLLLWEPPILSLSLYTTSICVTLLSSLPTEVKAHGWSPKKEKTSKETIS